MSTNPGAVPAKISADSNETVAALLDTQKTAPHEEFMCKPWPGAESKEYSLLSPRQKRSPVWKWFHVIGNQHCHPDRFLPKPVGYVCCNICGSTLKFKDSSGKQSGGALRSHMQSHRIALNEKFSTKRSTDMAFGSSQPSIDNAFASADGPKFRNKKDRRMFRLKRTCDWVVDTMQPFSAVAEESYKRMIQSYDGEAEPLSEISIKECLTAKEADVRKAVVQQAKGTTVSLTVDHWTSRAKHNYTGMTLHFIDKEWNLVSLPLGCFLHSGNSKSESLHDNFLVKLFNECGFQDLKITCVVSDTTTADMNWFGQLLEAFGKKLCVEMCATILIQH